MVQDFADFVGCNTWCGRNQESDYATHMRSSQ
jgi:hypothetical protein